MHNSKRFLMILIVLVLLTSSLGAAAPAPSAAACRAWHTVRRGQTLSSIAAYYGVYWPYLAQVNNIRAPRYTVYTGTALCIPSGGYYNPGSGYYPPGGYYPPSGGTGGYPVYYGGGRTWSFSVTGGVANDNVTIQTYNFPSNVFFQVRIGRYTGGAYTWENLPDLDTGDGGAFSTTFDIPAAFSGSNQLVLRLVQVKKNGRSFSQDQTFYNVSGGTGGIPGPGTYPPYYYYGYYGIPTIWIVGVQANTSVTIQTHNFPPGIAFDVFMGPMGTRGYGGYHVGTLNSGAGGTLVATFSIPAQLAGAPQISIRTQNWPSGYYSYNWFYNNTTY